MSARVFSPGFTEYQVAPSLTARLVFSDSQLDPAPVGYPDAIAALEEIARQLKAEQVEVAAAAERAAGAELERQQRDAQIAQDDAAKIEKLKAKKAAATPK